ncbi:unnamed protein product [Amoebophrya sp. A25]|nr:unnamed protein product [Amoebophrya sp. A25]|eukprot:GSA25T00016954001.1
MSLLGPALRRAAAAPRYNPFGLGLGSQRFFGSVVPNAGAAPTTIDHRALAAKVGHVQRNIMAEAQRCIIIAGLAHNPNVPQYDTPIGTPNNDMRRVGEVPHGYRHTHFVNTQHTRNTTQYTKKLLPIIYFHFVEVVWLLIMYQFA